MVSDKESYSITLNILKDGFGFRQGIIQHKIKYPERRIWFQTRNHTAYNKYYEILYLRRMLYSKDKNPFFL